MSDRLGDLQVTVSNHSEHPMGCSCDLCFFYAKICSLEGELLTQTEMATKAIEDATAFIEKTDAEWARKLGDMADQGAKKLSASQGELAEAKDEIRALVMADIVIRNEREGAKKLAQDRTQEYLEMKAELAEARKLLSNNEGRVKAIVDESLIAERDTATARVEELEKACKEARDVAEKYRGAFSAGNLDVFREIYFLLKAAKEGKGK